MIAPLGVAKGHFGVVRGILRLAEDHLTCWERAKSDIQQSNRRRNPQMENNRERENVARRVGEFGFSASIPPVLTQQQRPSLCSIPLPACLSDEILESMVALMIPPMRSLNGGTFSAMPLVILSSSLRASFLESRTPTIVNGGPSSLLKSFNQAHVVRIIVRIEWTRITTVAFNTDVVASVIASNESAIRFDSLDFPGGHGS
ncbi:hypothetical protein BDZ45DRAFT_747638 [Acephala macrosclerotiorum]|nr:hypothetical protein BDZ45DRAFT_747638 [Acephala macrosclerotiorum]